MPGLEKGEKVSQPILHESLLVCALLTFLSQRLSWKSCVCAWEYCWPFSTLRIFVEEQESFELCLWASGDELMFVPECKSRYICSERFYMISVEIVK